LDSSMDNSDPLAYDRPHLLSVRNLLYLLGSIVFKSM
jgi:hypothetical protein